MVFICDSLGWMDLLTVACLGVASLLLLRTITVDEALRSTRPRILLMIAASFALGSALQNTGVATWVARSLVDLTTSSGRFGLLLGVSIATSLINALVSNNACMVLMFPVCVTVSAA
jgi:di/tricarboxylate transporter